MLNYPSHKWKIERDRECFEAFEAIWKVGTTNKLRKSENVRTD